MRKTNTKRHALFTSVISLLLCVSMLMGTTFAWFTDSVKSGINTIAAGVLDVELYHSNAVVTEQKVDSSTQLFLDLQGDPILWEPGVVSYENLRVANEGDLALAYQLTLNTANENYILDPSGAQYGLSQILKVGVVPGGITATDRAGVVASVADTDWTTLANFLRSGSLLPEDGKTQETWGVVVYWQPGETDNYWNLNNGKQLSSGEMLQIDLGVKLVATQESYESDSFGTDFDAEAKPAVFPNFVGGSASATVIPNEQNQTSDEVTLSAGAVAATVPAGVQLADGTTELQLNVSMMGASGSNITLGENEDMRSLDVHIAGVAANNTTPITVTLKEAAPMGLNLGNYKVYHVEESGTKEMTLVAAADAFTAHNQFKYDPATGDVTLYMATFSEVAVVADTENAWEGKFDYSWYTNSNARTATSDYIIANGDQLAAFGAIVGGMAEGIDRDSFKDKTVKLISDINLGDKESKNNSNIIFYPIGYNSDDGKYEKTGVAINSSLKTFEGTFDGQGHTISNFYHNTWEMKGDHNWYSPEEQYYRDGMGLFGRVYKGTVKNVAVSNFSSDGEIATTGCIAAYADGATFENIAIFNCNPRVYNIGNGGIVGCVGWYAKDAGLKTTFTNITVDNSNKISALWGSYDVACGGIVGQYYPTSGQTSANTPANGGISFENCHISAQMDVYNDVCANYQYYAYRYTGMLIGSVRENVTIDGHTYPKMDGITAKNCTVHFGTWNDYYYCEIIDNTTASYTHDYQMSRLTEIKAIDGTTITYLDGTTGTVPASGRANYVIVDYTKGHGTENATCYHFKDGAVWTHDMGGIQAGIDENGDGQDDLKEDKQHIYLEFNNLVTGYGWGVTTKVVGELEGVTILDRKVGNSVKKFEGKVTELANNKTYKLSDIFSFVNNGVELVPSALAVAVNNLDENNPVSATIVYDRENWENGTLTLNGTGKVQITIQDYYFCTPTTIEVTITDRQPEVKFETKFTGDFLYRVGNQNAVKLDSLFKEKEGATIGTVDVRVDALNGTGASGTYTSNATWTNGTIQFSGTGVVKVTITDNDYCIPAVLNLEVVDAVNVTTATSATKNNVVLLNDCGFGSLEVSGGYTLYGNGFALTCSSDSVAIDRNYGFVVLKNGTLDNVNVVVPNFSHAILFDTNKTEGGNPSETDTNNRTRYYNIRSAVVMEGNSEIANSMISGGRAAVYVANGKANITNSTIKGGAAANVHVERTAAVTLNDITLIQKPIKANVNDTSKTLMGLSVVTLCDSDGVGGTIVLTGKLRQYAWAREDYKQYVPQQGQSLVSNVLNQTEYTHDITFADGVTAKAVNLGIVFMPDGLSSTSDSSLNDQRGESEKNAVPYGTVEISKAKVYTYKNDKGTNDGVQVEPGYSASQQMSAMPEIAFSDTSANRVFTTAYDESTGWSSTLKVDLDAGNYSFNFANLLVKKYGTNLTYTVKTADGATVDKNTAILLSDTGSKEYKLQIVDNLIYDKDGNLTGETESKTHTFRILSTKTSISGPVWKTKPDPSANDVKNIKKSSYSSDWSLAIPVLKDAVITYWSKDEGKYVDLNLTDLTPATNGKQANGANEWSVAVDGEYSLKITSSVFKTNYAGMPVVYEENGIKTLYYTVNNSNGCLGSGTTSRQITITYKFTDANNNVLDDSVIWNINKSDMPSKTINYSTFIEGGGSSSSGGGSDPCVTPDTLVTLADGTLKRIDEISYTDKLLVWNFFKGKYDVAPAAIIFDHGADDNTVIKLTFDDGTVVKVVNMHQFFDADLNRFVTITEDTVKDYIGHRFAQYNGNGTSFVKLADYDISYEYVEAWGVMTAGHYNIITAGMISADFDLKDVDLFNYFQVGKNMKFDTKKMQEDIKKYGLYTYEDFAEYLTYEQFLAFNVRYFKIPVEKGLYTYDGILELIEQYLSD